ncbi:MAG TPA: hypothetical protein VGX28_07895 [Frankiaceae bacterium]|nr:hypothetical protein [Frankiaceae bacterium]
MTRPVLVSVLAALALAAPASAAPPQVTDPAGDWVVPSQDVLGVRIERATVDGRPAVRTVLTLAAAPDPAGTYYTFVSLGCDQWTLGNRWYAHPEPFLVRGRCDTATPELPVFEPATMAISGNELAFIAVLPAGTRDRRVDGIGGHTSVGSPAGVMVNGVLVMNGDVAGGRVRHTL